jgi:hypothetical protein
MVAVMESPLKEVLIRTPRGSSSGFGETAAGAMERRMDAGHRDIRGDAVYALSAIKGKYPDGPARDYASTASAS